MLAKFTVKNFRGFKEKLELNLAFHKDYEFNSFAIKDDIVKNGIIYGPNGSGKTNLGLAIFDIVNLLTNRFQKADYYLNFANAETPDEPVEFEYTFKLGEDMLSYKYSRDSSLFLIMEQMSVNDSEVFFRDSSEFRLSSEYRISKLQKNMIMSSVNHVPVVNYLIASYPLKQDHYLIRFKSFVESMLWFRCLDTREFIGLENSSTNIDEFIISNDLLDDFSGFLADVSEQHFVFPEESNKGKNLFCRIGSKDVPFDDIASTGTESLKLLYYWVKRMNDASFVFIDEFDAFYHFRLAASVCRRLFSLDAQVFLSSHNTFLTQNDLLRPDCNFLLKDNEVRPLCNCTDKELRFGNNIEKLYRGGTFN